MKTLTLKIESVASGGKGIARLDGKVWFVADGVPGDELEARIVTDNDRYGEAELIRLLTPSALRTPPPCAYAHECGGCQWMGIPYEQQLEWKTQFVTSALQRIGRLNDDFAVPILPSPRLYQYRNRILLRLHVTPAGKTQLGYFKRGSRDLVAITRCEIAEDAINKFITRLRSLDLSDLRTLRLRLEVQQIELSASKTPTKDSASEASQEPGRVVVTVFPGDGRSPAVEQFVERIGRLPEVRWAGLVFDLPQAPVVSFESDLDVQFLTLPGQFQQVNVRHNHTLRRLVKDHVEAVNPRRVLDVFCGSGNLSLPLANGERYIEGVEANKNAIAVARKNAEANLLANVTYMAGDAEKHLWTCSKRGDQFDLVILDPPRQGMHQGMTPLKNLAPRHIIYVSCDPATLARDLGTLTKSDQYRIDRIMCLDFFPNTFHVETIAFLSRTESHDKGA